MSSFASIWMQMLQEQEVGGPPLLAADTATEDDGASMEVFRKGMQFRSSNEPDATFWNELRKLACEDKKGLAKLLQISPTIVSKWAVIIDEHLKKVTNLDKQQDGVKKPEMIPTGIQQPAVKIQGNFGDNN